ncbi:OLC1v1028766C1 [Oldenlandia corymbosa var. corymbosa]|uniref:OLC1v1028766C1 n=1 Tax=Oldenlandia corymbosa var. corymbosa TaxID=529605 RepID=A0AAV1CFD7_OLDCO|nr:OLC1v1028766C1 [Oldenlandia corymbosa var. corymbosa]
MSENSNGFPEVEEGSVENPDSNVLAEPTSAAVTDAAAHGVEPVHELDNSKPMEDKPNDAKVVEDGGRDDMFVDCPDEIETSETTSEDREEIQNAQVEEIQSRPSREGEDLIAEIDVLHTKLEEAVSEKQTVVQKYEEERGTLMEIADRVLAFFPPTVDQGEQFSDDFVRDKFLHVERSISVLIENYNQCLSGVEKLKSCLRVVKPDVSMEDKVGIFVIAHDELLELRTKEKDLEGKLTHFENENTKLIEQIEKNKAVIESANAKIGKLEAELEQEKTKSSNTKEKLSLAVTKGKALVQQRDSLKQALAEKTSQLEKCLSELQEKSSALDSAGQDKDLLIKAEMMAVQLQESLTQKDSLLKKCEEILSDTDEVESMDFVEKLRWISNERNALKGLKLQVQKFSEALSPVIFPENILSNDMESQLTWLAQSFSAYKEEVIKLQEEIVETREASNKVIEHLVALSSAETQEKGYLQVELEDLRSKYERIFVKENQVSRERYEIVNMLLEASGMTTIDTPGNVNISPSDLATIIGKLKEEAKESTESFESHAGIFDKFQSLLFVRNQEMVLCQHLLEEEVVTYRAKVDEISDKFVALNEELQKLKDEKASLEAELVKSEDKAALIRDKLSKAVKKGKGLVQERDNLKKVIDEKIAENERLVAELQVQTSECNDLRNQVTKLVVDVGSIPMLETELVAVKEQRNQLEQFLVESNGMLQKVIDLVEKINLPDGLVFKEPVEKVKWLTEYVNEAQHEIEKLKEESSTLNDALSVAQNSVANVLEEKGELEAVKDQTERELQRALEEVALQKGKFTEVSANIKSFEDALTEAEENISNLTREKEDAVSSKEVIELELSRSNDRLADAEKTIQSLEDALSQAQKSLSLMAEEHKMRDIGRGDLEDEMKKLKEEVESQAIKLADAAVTVKSLEAAISDAENRISDLVKGNKMAEQEISDLNSKLQVCYQELDESRGRKSNTSSELVNLVASIQKMQNDDTVSSILKQSFDKKVESLKDVDILLEEIRDCFSDMIGSDMLQNHSFPEDDYFVATLLPDGLEEVFKIEMINGEVTHGMRDDDSIVLHMKRTIEGLQLRDKNAAEQIERCSRFQDDFIMALLKRLRVAKDGVIVASKLISSLKQRVSDVERDSQAQENAISVLESDVKMLLSACTQATEELAQEIEVNLSVLNSIHQSENLMNSDSLELHDGLVNSEVKFEGSRYVKTAEDLLLASLRSRNLSEEIHKLINMVVSSADDLQKELRETKATCEKLSEERDVTLKKISELENNLAAMGNLQNELSESKIMCERLLEERVTNLKRISKLEDDLGMVENLEKELRETEITCNNLLEEREVNLKKISELETNLVAAENLYDEVRHKADDYQAREAALLKEREKHETEELPLSSSLIKSLFEKMSAIDISFTELEVENFENHYVAADVRKLFYIVDKFDGLREQVKSKFQENKSMTSMLEKQEIEMQHLKEEVEESLIKMQEAEKTETELVLRLKNLIQKLGVGDDFVADVVKIDDLSGCLLTLEKMVRSTKAESENLTSKNEELSAKLLATQKMLDELSGQVKLLKDSSHGGATFPEKIKEKGISEPSSSNSEPEISEIQDLGPMGKTAALTAVPSAAHVRTLRKGSSDHLAISIDPESERLIDNEQSDLDKGHVFKSLNTSGLIPRQGKMIADRVDGIWVSGSRVLMNHPRGRLGLIAYCLFLHLWLLGTIL